MESTDASRYLAPLNTGNPILSVGAIQRSSDGLDVDHPSLGKSGGSTPTDMCPMLIHDTRMFGAIPAK
jgi:hypothetical protein